MGALLSWVEGNTVAVTAISALLTALATVAIAVASIGTIALYRLEKSREAGRRGALAGHLVRLRNHFDSAAEMLRESIRKDPTVRGLGRDAAAFLKAENARRRLQIEQLFDQAAAAPMEVMAALDAALILLIGVEGFIEELEKMLPGSDAARLAEQIATELTDAANGFHRAYEATPPEARRWSGGTKDYDQLVQDFVSPTRARMLGGVSEPAASGS